MNFSPLARVACALAVCAAPALAQNKLTTLFASNNGLGNGAATYMDFTVTNPIRITAIDINTSASGTTANIDVYMTAAGTSYSGNETNAAAWTLMASGSGPTNGNNTPSPMTLANPLLIQPGVYGICIHYLDTDVDYTNGTGTNQQFMDANLQIDLGTSQSTLFVANPFSPRIANCTICYTLGSGLFVNFEGTPTSGSSPLNVQFTDTTFSSSGTITGYSWDFGDGNTSTAQNPMHTYTTGGRFTVTLTVADSNFGSGAETKTDYIEVDIVDCGFTASGTFGAAPYAVTFTDTSTGAPTSWSWDFGDGNTSTAQNPMHTYTAGGTYTVTLVAGNANGTSTCVETDLIRVLGSTNNTKSAEILEFQFNEVRGQTVNNTASTTAAPATAMVNTAGWQADPGRVEFSGNDAGAGCLGTSGMVANTNIVSTGYALDVTDMTLMWWQRSQSLAGTSLAYAFGGSGASFRCFTGGVAGPVMLYRGTPIGDVPSTTDIQANIGVWTHIALIVDNQAGTATWYVNGVADGGVTFTPGTHIAQNTDFHIGYHTSTTTTYTGDYDMDDFRLYGRALSVAELQTAMMNENPTTSNFGESCDGPSGAPTLSASGGAPCIGNANFAIDADNVEPGVPAVINFDLFVTGALLPFDLSPFLGTGCQAELLPNYGVLSIAGPSQSLSFPIPNDAGLSNAHIYFQILALGSQGAASNVLDVSIK